MNTEQYLCDVKFVFNATIPSEIFMNILQASCRYFPIFVVGLYRKKCGTNYLKQKIDESMLIEATKF